MSDPQQMIIKQALDSLNSSLSILESLSVLPPSDVALIRSKLPSPNNGAYPTRVNSPGGSVLDEYSQAAQQQSSSPYPPPIYGQQGGPTRAPPALPGRNAGLGEARAQWDYTGSAADDLSFRKDDIIVITEEANSDWWKGYVSNNPSRIGLFPSNYTTRLPTMNNLPPRPYSSSPNPSYEKQAYGPPPGSPYQQPPQHYGYNQQPMVPYQQQPPYQQPPQQQMMQPPPQQQQQVVQHQEQPPQKQGKFDGMGRLLATSAVGGVGFGAGSAVGSGIINAIF